MAKASISKSEVLNALRTLRTPSSFDVIVAYIRVTNPEISARPPILEILVNTALRAVVREGLILNAPGGMYSYVATKQDGSPHNKKRDGKLGRSSTIQGKSTKKHRQGNDKEFGCKRQNKKTELPKKLSDSNNTLKNEIVPKENFAEPIAETPVAELTVLPGTSSADLKNLSKKKVVCALTAKQKLTDIYGTANDDSMNVPKKVALGWKKRPPAGKESMIGLTGTSSYALMNCPRKDIKSKSIHHAGRKDALTELYGTSGYLFRTMPKQQVRKTSFPAVKSLLTELAVTMSDNLKNCPPKCIGGKKNHSSDEKKSLSELAGTSAKEPVVHNKNPLLCEKNSLTKSLPWTANDHFKNIPKSIKKRLPGEIVPGESLTEFYGTESDGTLHNNQLSAAGKDSLTEPSGATIDDLKNCPRKDVDGKKSHSSGEKNSFNELRGASTGHLKQPAVGKMENSSAGKGWLAGLLGMSSVGLNKCLKNKVACTEQSPAFRKKPLPDLPGISRDDSKNCPKNEVNGRKNRSLLGKQFLTLFSGALNEEFKNCHTKAVGQQSLAEEERLAGLLAAATDDCNNCPKKKAVCKRKRSPAGKELLTALLGTSKQKIRTTDSATMAVENDKLQAHPKMAGKSAQNKKVQTSKKGAKKRSVAKTVKMKERVYF